jgi:excisionase family DNA binding protein
MNLTDQTVRFVGVRCFFYMGHEAGLSQSRRQPFTRLRVRHIRATHDIPSLAEHLHRAGWLTVTEIAAQLGVHHTTANRFAREGVLQAMRVDDHGSLLFEPPTGPLPRAQPGKRFRDRRRYPQCASHKRKELQYEA